MEEGEFRHARTPAPRGGLAAMGVGGQEPWTHLDPESQCMSLRGWMGARKGCLSKVLETKLLYPKL